MSFFVLVLFGSTVIQPNWTKTYGGTGTDVGLTVRQTYDGGYVVGAISIESDADTSPVLFLLVKTDSDGDTLWTHTYDGCGTHDMDCCCVQQTSDGGYIILGFANIEMFPIPVGDLWLIKTDSQGDTLWTKFYRGGSYSWHCWVEQTTDGGFILTSNWDAAYLLLLKTDKDGNTVWSKNYQWGDKKEIGYCVRQTSDGGYAVATSLGLLKTDSQGDSLWMKPWISECVEQTTDGGYILATGHNNDIWLIKTDFKGDTVWTRTYGGDSADISCDVHQTKDGGYVIFGASTSFGGIWLLKTDDKGDTLWTRILQGEDKRYGVSSGQQTGDGGYIITGSTSGTGADWRPDVLLIKTDSLGYAGIEEPVPVTHQLDWQVVSPIGPTVTLRYEDLPQGFHAFVFDASGRKVDEIESQGESGTIAWGQGMGAGVYFVKEKSDHSTTQKVVLIR